MSRIARLSAGGTALLALEMPFKAFLVPILGTTRIQFYFFEFFYCKIGANE